MGDPCHPVDGTRAMGGDRQVGGLYRVARPGLREPRRRRNCLPSSRENVGGRMDTSTMRTMWTIRRCSTASKLVRKPGGAVEWIPSLIHNASGVGTQIVAKDINKDGRIEIVTTARKGTFVFHGRSRSRTIWRKLHVLSPAWLPCAKVLRNCNLHGVSPRS